MGELKQHQLPMTIDEQIENLKSLGLIIENEEYAKKILNDISYFRLIKAYSLGFKPKNGKYTQAGIGNNRIFGVLLCMKQILKNDKHWNLYVDQIELLIDKYEKVDVKTMGFPDDWKKLLEQK